MALAAANVRIKAFLARFKTSGINLNLLFKKRKRPRQARDQFHMLASIGEQDARHRTRCTELRFPEERRHSRTQQPAFLIIAATEIITEEIAAFFSCWGSHAILI